ncbi:MAG: hypothetical protein MI867_17240, partial [Pseudomonadales bacterium]|nr:hypothetical protein [Pseudomonadales bacterium]
MVAFATGNYQIHYVNMPGANEHGGLTNSGTASESLSPGDLDSFTFEASSGDSGSFSIAGTVNAYLYFYEPDGSYITYT